jgi:hypothetical protein
LKNDNSIPPLSIVLTVAILTVASIDCAKDSREISGRPVATPINDSLKWIYKRFIVVHGQQGK